MPAPQPVRGVVGVDGATHALVPAVVDASEISSDVHSALRFGLALPMPATASRNGHPGAEQRTL